MFLKLFSVICVQTTVLAQINGEFWWLSDKVQRANKIEGPQFERITQFDTDESDRVVFGYEDNQLDFSKTHKKGPREGKVNSLYNIEYGDRNGLVWHTHDNLVANETDNKANFAKENITSLHYEDEFNFYYPNDDRSVNKVTDIVTTSEDVTTASDTEINGIVTNEKVKSVPKPASNHENICSYMDEEECKLHEGLVYKPNKKRSSKFEIKSYFTHHLICCILPIDTDDKATHKVIFPESSPKKTIRFARSTNYEQSTALKQRQALMHRMSPQFQNFKVTSPPRITEKIITPDYDDHDYVDPYANIKNKVSKPPSNTNYPFTKPSYGVQDYDYEPTEELPRPGLVGLYSDGQWSGTWNFDNDDVFTDDEENDEVGYGFSTLDPRLDKRKGWSTAKPPKRRLPVKVSTSEDSSSYESGSQTVSYQSNPNFNVLQGFKLINLVRNKSRTHTKNSRKSTTERIYEENDNYSPESVIIDASDGGSEYDEFVVSDKQVFKECGRTLNNQAFDGRQGEAAYNSNPWLGLAVRSRQRRVVCHATLVHPRAAVTAANCVHGAAPGEITLYAGLWDLSDEDNKLSQQRMASVHLHPRFNPGNIAYDLAILHWNRPLHLGANVQPACLADPHVGDCCAFVGWGGRGQAINERPHWQRATVVTPRECHRLVKGSGVRLPKDAFCASADTQGCVVRLQGPRDLPSKTGIGGTLVCSSNGKRAAVGVVVSRESCDVTSPVIMLPAHDWIRRALSGLGIV